MLASVVFMCDIAHNDGKSLPEPQPSGIHEMRSNQPVTQREYDYPADLMLVSSTNTKGEITHCNRAFVEASGFEYDELIG